MAQSFLKKARKIFSGKNLQESYASIILGGIIVIVLGLLVANYFTKRNQEIGSGEQTEQNQETVGQEYKVTKGDSLSLISERFYGNRDMWPVLARANSIKNPNIIFVEAVINIPPKVEAEAMIGQMTQTTYKVEPGDTLFKISEKLYGNGSKWVILDKANNVGRLPNGNPLIFAGNTLKIPR